jgi:hypothetical protein
MASGQRSECREMEPSDPIIRSVRCPIKWKNTTEAAFSYFSPSCRSYSSIDGIAATISCFVQMTNFSVVTTLLLCLACASNSYKFLGSFSLKTSRICQSQSALSSSPERPRSSEPRKWEIKNKDSGAPQGGAGQSGEKDWKSGYVFNKHTQKKRRNDPWWMREEESNNPRILPAYKPWWVTDNVIVDDSWKVADLRAEAAKRGKFIFETKQQLTRPFTMTLSPQSLYASFWFFVILMTYNSPYSIQLCITGLDTKGKKEELLKLIKDSSALRDLKDSGFRVPIYIECKPSDRPSCYPEIYEGAESATALRNKAMNSLKAPSA